MSDTQTCKHCTTQGIGKFCNQCGQSYVTKRLTIGGIAHEIFHFFSHLDKGFLYTLKQLIVAPGKMQLAYVEGHRIKHQKPFSMFFLTATITTLMYYWSNLALLHYFKAGNANEASFFHQYYVILQVTMLPVYAMITFLTFLRNGFNYVETLVLLLYNLSPILLASGLLLILKFIWTDLETRYLEIPIVIVYNIITNINFYRASSKWIVIPKTIFASIICFLLASYVQDFLITFLS